MNVHQYSEFFGPGKVGGSGPPWPCVLIVYKTLCTRLCMGLLWLVGSIKL